MAMTVSLRKAPVEKSAGAFFLKKKSKMAAAIKGLKTKQSINIK
jgi:hypothetical protein